MTEPDASGSRQDDDAAPRVVGVGPWQGEWPAGERWDPELLRNGDRIVIDADAGTIDVLLPEEELAARKAAWKPRGTDYNSGALWKYAQLVGPAHLGAVTHPGGAAETHSYPDL